MGANVFKIFRHENGRCPFNTLLDNSLHVFVVERGANFVTGVEVENLTKATAPSATTAENVAVFIPSTENQLFGSGDEEGLTVHFLV